MIILRDKEFNSKAQKLLRRASDYKKAMTGSGRLVSREAKQINRGMSALGNSENILIKRGRELNQDPVGLGSGVNQSINMKTRSSDLTTGANIMRSPNFYGKRGLGFYKKTASDQKKVMKNYDHGKGDVSERIKSSKNIMLLNH